MSADPPIVRKKKRGRMPRQLKSTREGKAVVLLTLGLGFGAVNSGNNLLYLILGMLLSLIIVSGVLSEISVREVRVTRRYGGGFHAGSPALCPVELVNDKRRQSSFSLEIEECLTLPPGTTLEQRPAHTLVIAPKERADASIRFWAPRRGVYASTGLRIATRFPFGFFRKSREVDLPTEVVVWPEVRRVAMPPSLTAGLLGADADPQRVGRGEEYHGLREHRLEDDRRDIHWKSSARLGRLVVREWEAPATRRVWLHLRNSAADPETALALEGAIVHAASLAAQLLGAGFSVGLRTLDGSVGLGLGSSHLPNLLDLLARLTAHPNGPPLQPAGDRGDRILIRYPGMGETPGDYAAVVDADVFHAPVRGEEAARAV